MGALGFGMIGTGLALVWSGIRGENFVQILTSVVSGQRKLSKAHAPTTSVAGSTSAGGAPSTQGGATGGPKGQSGGNTGPSLLGDVHAGKAQQSNPLGGTR